MHAGTEKTGSSYLQKLCGKNRSFLKDHGIWFPTAGRHEKRLQKGTISPGNASKLSSYAENANWDAVSSWLAERVQEAASKGCGRLLLSNELIFAALSSAGAGRQFERAVAEAGIGKISMLVMIRDPVEHALSLYKHRAKNGLSGHVEDWIGRNYPLPQQLTGFLREIETCGIELQLRKYKKETASIVAAYFNDWLEVDVPPNRIESLVNPSLSMAELAVIRHLAATRPTDLSAFYSRFLSVPPNEKARSGSLEKSARAAVEQFLCQFNEIWETLDSRLAPDGGLKIPQERHINEAGAAKYAFTDVQLRALVEAHSESSSARYALRQWFSGTMRPTVGRLIRRFAPQFRGR